MKISNRDIVHAIIHNYIKKSKSFTFFDIAKDAKKNGCTLDAFQIPPIIKTAYYPINYKVTPIMISDRVIEIYHIDSNDPKKYDHKAIINSIRKIPKRKNTIRMNRKHAPVTDVSGKSKNELMEDYRNGKISPRLNVPAQKVKQAGFKINDTVEIIFHNDYIEIVKFTIADAFRSVRKQCPNPVVKIDCYHSCRLRANNIIEKYGSIDIVDIVTSDGKIKIFIKR